jgi:hypothetical protein
MLARAVRAFGIVVPIRRGRCEDRLALDTDALAAIGIDLDEVRRRIDAAFGPGALYRTRAARRRGL